jgi:hypothetical protein
MSWKKMDTDMRLTALQELACALIAILAGLGLGYVSGSFMSHKIPAGLRYIGSFLFSWYVFLPFLVHNIAHKGTDSHNRIPRK